MERGARTMSYPIEKHNHTINGVAGEMGTVSEPKDVRGRLVHRSQEWKSVSRRIKGYGTNGTMIVSIRFDDRCGNGHQSFSITAYVYTDESRRQRDIAAGGCMHEEIAKRFPELAPLIKWHLMDADGPMHYIANTLYHAGDQDCNGLRKGETRQIRNGKTGLLAWKPEATEKLEQYVDSATCPEVQAATRYVPWLRTGEGKERRLDYARSSAVWPEATDDQLCLPKEELRTLLEARSPALIEAFKADMERIGMLWEPTP